MAYKHGSVGTAIEIKRVRQTRLWVQKLEIEMENIESNNIALAAFLLLVALIVSAPVAFSV